MAQPKMANITKLNLTDLRIPDERVESLGDRFPVFVEAYQTKHIGLLTDDEYTRELTTIIAECYQALGQKSDAKDLSVLVYQVKRELFNFTLMRIGEIRVAFRKGVRGEYPESNHSVTINLVRIIGWIKAYRQSQERKEFLDEYHKLEPKKIPTHDERFETAKWNAIKACGYKKMGRDFSILGVAVYDFLKVIELINFSKDERWKFWEKAKEAAKLELKFKKQTEASEIKRMDIQKSLEEIEAGNNDQLVINKSKKIALDYYFEELLLNGEDLEELIDDSKWKYMNYLNKP